MLSMLLLTLAKGRQTDTSKRLLWVWCTSLQELPIHWGSFLQRHQWRKPCRKPSLGWFAWAFAQASFIGNLEAADICRHLQTVLNVFGYLWILRIGMPRVYDPSNRHCSRSQSLLASNAELQCGLSSVWSSIFQDADDYLMIHSINGSHIHDADTTKYETNRIPKSSWQLDVKIICRRNILQKCHGDWCLGPEPLKMIQRVTWSDASVSMSWSGTWSHMGCATGP